MARYKVIYKYEEYGKGRAPIEADSVEKCREKFDNKEWSHELEEIEDSSETILAILNLDTGKFEYSELDEIAELQIKQAEGIDEPPFDDDQSEE